MVEGNKVLPFFYFVALSEIMSLFLTDISIQICLGPSYWRDEIEPLEDVYCPPSLLLCHELARLAARIGGRQRSSRCILCLAMGVLRPS